MANTYENKYLDGVGLTHLWTKIKDYVSANSSKYTLPTATTSKLGGVMLASDTVQTVAAVGPTNVSNRTYAIQANSSGQLVVNVPWSNTNTTLSGLAYCTTAATTATKTASMPGFALSSGQYILLRTTVTNTATSNVKLDVNSTGAKPIKIGNSSTAPTASNFPAGDYLAKYDGTNWVLTRIYLTDTKYNIATSSALGLVKSTTTGTTANRTYNVEVNTDGTMKVNVPWTDTKPRTENADIIYWDTATNPQLVQDLLGAFIINDEVNYIRAATANEIDFFETIMSEIRNGRRVAGIYIYDGTTPSSSVLIAYLQLSLINGTTVTFTVYNLEFASEPTYGYIVEYSNNSIFLAKTRLATQTDLSAYLKSESDTLQSVTDRGSTTTNHIYFSGIGSASTNSKQIIWGTDSTKYGYITASTANQFAFGVNNSTIVLIGQNYIGPNTSLDNNADLGRSEGAWKNLYLKGKIINGSNQYALPTASGTLARVEDIPSLSGYVTGTDLTSGNIIVGDGNGVVKDSEWSLLTLIAAAEGATDTYVIKSKEDGLTLASSSIVNQPDSSKQAIAITEIKTNTDTTIPVSSLKLGDIVLSIATDESDYFVAAVYDSYVILAELETRSINLSSYTTGSDNSTDNAIVRFDGTTGKKVQNSTATLTDAGKLTVASQEITGTGGLTFTNSTCDLKLYTSSATRDYASIETSSGRSLFLQPLSSGSVVIGDTTKVEDLTNKLKVVGTSKFTGVITNTVADGTAPFAITSTTLNTNLNADLLDGKHASDFALSSSIGNGTLTIQKNGTAITTFTANQSGNTTANITVPTKVSELTNDSGFISSYTDTKNTTGSTNDEAKLYLVGAKSQAANPQTFSDAEVYTQAGELNATSMCVAEHGQIKYDSTNQCIRFVIV